MNPKTTISLAALILAATSAATNAKSVEPLVDRTALVVNLQETVGHSCGPPRIPKGNDTFWGLNPNKSKFKFYRPAEVVHKIKRKKPITTEMKEMEELAFYVFNEDKPWLDVSPCDTQSGFDKFPFGIAFHNVTNPNTDEKSPHAIIFVPVKVARADGEYKPLQFYLLVDAVLTKEQCDNETNPDIREGCHAFRTLYDIQDNTPVTNYIGEISKRIDLFRAALRMEKPKFHNGVIHGNL